MAAQAPAPPPAPHQNRQPAAEANARRMTSEELFGAELEVEIKHGDAVYRLRRTSSGKLILTK